MDKTIDTNLIDGDSKITQYSFISNKIFPIFVVPQSNLFYLARRKYQSRHFTY